MPSNKQTVSLRSWNRKMFGIQFFLEPEKTVVSLKFEWRINWLINCFRLPGLNICWHTVMNEQFDADLVALQLEGCAEHRIWNRSLSWLWHDTCQDHEVERLLLTVFIKCHSVSYVTFNAKLTLSWMKYDCILSPRHLSLCFCFKQVLSFVTEMIHPPNQTGTQ